MIVSDWINELQRQGVTLTLAGGHQLDVDGPSEVLTDTVVTALRQNKDAILARLEAAEERAVIQAEEQNEAVVDESQLSFPIENAFLATPSTTSAPDTRSSDKVAVGSHEHLADARRDTLTDWMVRRGAGRRIGYDRPAQLVASRWWERFSFEELPEPPVALSGGAS